MASIKPIEGASVHKIQSGQVIVDLCSVVKELVENSLDAGASSIDVRFKNNGLDLIEVQDNGSGIAKEDYETIALKHYTSKLSSYEDLASLQTFGFRGEALSSLCALSNVHITTAREDEVPKGTRLDFELSGRLKGTQVVASQRGTTVAVETIFKNLPVRRQELDKNIKREYGKVLVLLQAYACISINVKLTVSNVMAKGKKALVFATKPNPTTRENISNVFGAKTLSALVALDLEFEMQGTSGLADTEQDGGGKQVRVVGHVSRPVFGEGRQTPDRQMFFVNSRPCGLPQLAKLMNEVYKTYNLSQSPFIFANVLLDTNAYDVNVSPDKRTILLHDQGVLLENIKSSLIDLFDQQQQTVPQSHKPGQKLPLYKQLTLSRRNSVEEASEGSENPESSTSTGDRFALPDDDQQPESSTARTVNEKTDSLINQFLGRKAHNRTPQAVEQPIEKDSGGAGAVDKPSGKQKLANKLMRQQQTGDRIDEYENASDIAASDKLGRRVDLRVRDFNRHFAVQQGDFEELEEKSPPPSLELEQEIPSIRSTSVKPTPGVVPNAFERMRPIRTPDEDPIITVGSKTLTLPIQSPSLGRQHHPKTPIRQIIRGPSKSTLTSQKFGSSLRAFAAPGSQSVDSSNLEDDDELDMTDHFSEETREDSDSEDDEEYSRIAGPSQESADGVSGDVADVEKESGEREIQLKDDRILESPSDEESGDDYMDEAIKKAREEARVAQLIRDAEERSAVPSQDNLKRAENILKGRAKKDLTTNLIQTVNTSIGRVEKQLRQLDISMQEALHHAASADALALDDVNSAEERLSLTVSKEDFAYMRIIGQFNLGFIIAARPAHTRDIQSSSTTTLDDELFIIDQHASDEKYNFERLQASTIVQNQRLVQPQLLELTAIEEEIILENQSALLANGFHLSIDQTGASPVGQRCKLLSLPMSREVTFSTRDLEELIVLLADSTSTASSSVPRPSKVRKMFAMRACRSSVMIGKTLAVAQMESLVRHMGTIDKPWNCPHGRPTMRHVAGLGRWDGWEEGDGIAGTEDEGTGVRVKWEEWLEETEDPTEGESGGGDEGEDGDEAGAENAGGEESDDLDDDAVDF